MKASLKLPTALAASVVTAGAFCPHKHQDETPPSSDACKTPAAGSFTDVDAGFITVWYDADGGRLPSDDECCGTKTLNRSTGNCCPDEEGYDPSSMMCIQLI